jgi:hypothetical protein
MHHAYRGARACNDLQKGCLCVVVDVAAWLVSNIIPEIQQANNITTPTQHAPPAVVKQIMQEKSSTHYHVLD